MDIEDETKNQIKLKFKYLFKIMSDGCRREICFNPYCASNSGNYIFYIVYISLYIQFRLFLKILCLKINKLKVNDTQIDIVGIILETLL